MVEHDLACFLRPDKGTQLRGLCGLHNVNKKLNYFDASLLGHPPPTPSPRNLLNLLLAEMLTQCSIAKRFHSKLTGDKRHSVPGLRKEVTPGPGLEVGVLNLTFLTNATIPKASHSLLGFISRPFSFPLIGLKVHLIYVSHRFLMRCCEKMMHLHHQKLSGVRNR